MSTNRWVNPVNNNLLRDAEGALLPGGTLEIYQAGTSTPLAVYSDPDQQVSLGSILTADAYGLLPDFHLTAGTQFKAIAKDSDGATAWTRDYLFTADSSTDSRLDALEATVEALEGNTYNGLVNGGMRVGLRAVHNLTASFAEGKVNRLFGRVTNVTAGTLTQGEDTAYASARYAHFSGVSMSASGVVEAQIRVTAGEAGRFANREVVFSCLVRHDVGSAVDYTITVKKPSTTADDFSSLTTISTGSAASVASGVDTRLEIAVADMGDCTKGIAIEVSAAIASGITTKNFRITEALLEPGAVRTAFTEISYEVAESTLKLLNETPATESYADVGIDGAYADEVYSLTLTSGSGSWLKSLAAAAGAKDGDTVVFEGVGGGGSGGCVMDTGSTDNMAAAGGSGGAPFQYAVRFSDCPASVPYSIGAAGAARVRTTNGRTDGANGGDTTATIGSLVLTARGGIGGIAVFPDPGPATAADSAGVSPAFGAVNISSGLYTSGIGGGADSTGPVATAGGGSFFGGGGGGGASRSTTNEAQGAGGASIHAGAGGAGQATGASPTATSGASPGGGGGAACGRSGTITSGAGGAGELKIRVLRGWHPVMLGRL